MVNNAPDLREKWQRERTLALVNDMASTRHSVGPESVQFWMNEMGKSVSSRLQIITHGHVICRVSLHNKEIKTFISGDSFK